MKIFISFALCAIFATTTIIANAQQTDSKTGRVLDGDAQTTDKPPIDLSTFDFKNFTYPDLGGGKNPKTFTLKNGVAPLSRFWLRKTYFFELTRDKYDEAVTMLMTSDCATGCAERSLFYVHTPDKVNPKLIFNIAFGTDAACGLKAINFAVNEITLEAFGDCVLSGWNIVKSGAEANVPKPTNFTKITFARDGSVYKQESRETLPLETIDFATYRPQISFGEQQ